MFDVRRREVLTLLGGAAAAWPLAARAAGPRPRIAVLSINSEQDERKNIAAFVDGLRALGYVTSQNVDVDYRYADGDTTRLKPLAQELIAFKPDVALANSPSPAVAVQSVAPRLPIVCPQISDFLVPSLVVNYARPGGSVTGMASTVEGVATKLLQLALDAVPGSTRIGFLANPAGASMALWVQQVETAARARGVIVVGRGPVAREGLPPLRPDLKLDDTVPFRLSRNHFMIEKRDGNYYVRDLCSTLGTIVNGEPIGDHFRGDDAALRAGENEVIAGGVGSPFVFSVFIA
jgi:hypothetical protein